MTGTPCLLSETPDLLDLLIQALKSLTASPATALRPSGDQRWMCYPTSFVSCGCVVLFHILVEGECEVECQGLPLTTMGSGDVVVFPHGDRHTMRSHGAGTGMPLASIFSPGGHDEPPQLSYGGGGRTSRFVCGYLNCDQRFSPLVESLPTLLLVRSRDDYSAIDAIDARGSRLTALPQGSGTWLGTTLAMPPARTSHGADVRRDRA